MTRTVGPTGQESWSPPGTAPCLQVPLHGNAALGCWFPPRTKPKPRTPTPWPSRDWEPDTRVAFGSCFLEIVVIFGGYFTCSEEFMLQWIELYLYPSESSDELCLQLILFNLFALLSGAQQNQHADLSEM